MSAYEIPSLRFSAPSGAAVARFRFVKLNASEQGIQATLGSAAIGVSTQPCTAADQVLEIADGIVIVEAGAAVAIMDKVQSDADGKAIVRTSSGVILGTALTAASAAGELIAVKTAGAAGESGDVLVLTYNIAELAAGADLAATPFAVIPPNKKFTVLNAQIIALGANAGIDADNTCVVALKNGATVIATKTFNAVTTFPASGAASTLTLSGTAAELVVDAGEFLSVAVTNGATADPPATVLQVVGILEVA